MSVCVYCLLNFTSNHLLLQSSNSSVVVINRHWLFFESHQQSRAPVVWPRAFEWPRAAACCECDDETRRHLNLDCLRTADGGVERQPYSQRPPSSGRRVHLVVVNIAPLSGQRRLDCYTICTSDRRCSDGDHLMFTHPLAPPLTSLKTPLRLVMPTSVVLARTSGERPSNCRASMSRGASRTSPVC